MSFNKSDINRDACQLVGFQARMGYDWWWHSFTARNLSTGEERPFFAEFFLCNPDLGGKEPVFGQLKKNKVDGKRPSYLMVKLGCWGKNAIQLHRFFAWDDIEVSYGVPFAIHADNCELDENHLKASVSVSASDSKAHPEWMSDSGEIIMDLRIKKLIPYNVGYGAGPLFRKLQLFEMFWHAEGMKTEFEGFVTLNGETYNVSPETCYGYADKNWGKNFTSPWVWLSSNNLRSEITGRKLSNSVFDIGGGCPKIGPVRLPRKLLSAFWHEGKAYEFNFSKFWTLCKTDFISTEDAERIYWHIEQKASGVSLVADISCLKRDMLLINYESPDGEKRHNKLWNGGNGVGTVSLFRGDKLIDRVHAENVGCEYGEYC